jgi:hypothetical protein
MGTCTVATVNDVDGRLERAKDGTLSAEELQQVARELDSGESITDTYTLLHIIGRARGGEAYQSLVEQFLDHDDAMVMRISLQVLCQWWGKSAQYEDAIWRFLSGDERDEEGHIRIMAISCAGELMREHPNARLLEAVVAIVRNPDAEVPEREAASDAIVEAAGLALVDWIKSPAGARPDMNLVIATAQRRHGRPWSGLT